MGRLLLNGASISRLFAIEGKFTGFPRRFEGLPVCDDPQLLADDPHALQVLQDGLRHSSREVHETVVVPDFDPADIAAVHAGLVGDGLGHEGLATPRRTLEITIRRLSPIMMLAAYRVCCSYYGKSLTNKMYR